MKLAWLVLTLLLIPLALAVIGEGETYKVRHTRDYDRFLNAFEPYKIQFLHDLRTSKPSIYDGRLRKTYPIESINDDWLMEILYDKPSRNWNHIQLPSEVLQYGLGIDAQETQSGLIMDSRTSLYPSFTKHKTGGTFLPNHSDYLDQEGLQVTPEEIAWVRLNMYSLRNPITQKNIPVVSLSDEQIKAYLIDKQTKKIVRITPEKAKKELQTLGAYYRLYHQHFNLG